METVTVFVYIPVAMLLAPGAHERWMAIYSSNVSGRRFRTVR